ncbi:SAF domain-containing protein [Mesorhizobium sp. LMG 17147]|nr:SAF domain-containing protein [Mesorhizobium sp. LMG 17147]MCP9231789.1 SAF domain-containing protein [Mesorhizobium sp. LMG 17147]
MRHSKTGDKFVLRDLAPGSKVRKYGDVIGRLATPAVAGDHVHVHKLESLRRVEPRPLRSARRCPCVMKLGRSARAGRSISYFGWQASVHRSRPLE